MTAPAIQATSMTGRGLDREPRSSTARYIRGDLVFWPGHVGLCSATTSFIHANAHHHAVAVEATADALLRTDAASKAEGVILRLAP